MNRIRRAQLGSGVGVVVLAAGSATRMGYRAKSLLELDGISLIQRTLTAIFAAGVEEIVVVLGHYAESIEKAIQAFPVKKVRNAQPDDGNVSSLRLGLHTLKLECAAVLVALADQPLIDAQDIRALIASYQARPDGTQVVQPTVDGLPGNPVIFSAAVREQILDGDERFGCREWQAAHPNQVHRWKSSNHCYRIDMDTPEDIEALAARTGHRLKWPST